MVGTWVSALNAFSIALSVLEHLPNRVQLQIGSDILRKAGCVSFKSEVEAVVSAYSR